MAVTIITSLLLPISESRSIRITAQQLSPSDMSKYRLRPPRPHPNHSPKTLSPSKVRGMPVAMEYIIMVYYETAWKAQIHRRMAVHLTPCTSLSLLLSNMTTQLRDTKFGHVVRLITKNKVLQYPDEVDPAKWQAVLSAKPNRERPFGEAEGRTTVAASDSKLEKGEQAAFLVDWYGPDDPEVRCSSSHVSERLL